MFKYFLIFLLCILSIINVSASSVILPYDDNSSIVTYTLNSSDNYNFSTYSGNQIYSIQNIYLFGYVEIPTGTYYNNITFNNYVKDIKLSEKWVITSGILSYSVIYSISTYENDILNSVSVENYEVYKYTTSFTKTKYTFIDNIIEIDINYNDRFSYVSKYLELSLPNELILTQVNINNSFQTPSSLNVYIEYTQIGNKPKSYYIDKLNPLLKIPYKLIINRFDNNNNLLNLFLVSSYFISYLLFVIEIVYKSFFSLIIVILFGIIPIFSYINSSNRSTFIYKLFDNYKLFFMVIINFIKWFIDTIIKVINLIPFI